jgi:LuxR family maltose regulon positive regulatory protein
MLYTEGLAYLIAGDPDQAEPLLAHALDAAANTGAAPLSALILAQRALVAVEVGDWNAAASHSQQARTLIDEHSLHEYWTSALVFALAARVALHRGDVHGGRDNAARAARLRPLLTYALPVVSVQALLELGRVYVALSDTAGAREVVRQARDILQQRPELGVLPKQVDELGDRLDGMRSGAAGATSLTTAELRLVPFLSTHLTFPAIGERLHISRHTVKSQAISIYQKLGVSSRSEAIQRMQEIGLLDS